VSADILMRTNRALRHRFEAHSARTPVYFEIEGSRVRLGGTMHAVQNENI